MLATARRRRGVQSMSRSSRLERLDTHRTNGRWRDPGRCCTVLAGIGTAAARTSAALSTTAGDSMSRKIRAAFAVALAAAGLTGCAGLNGYSVRDESAIQQDIIGDVVHVAATLCLDDAGLFSGSGDALRRSLAIPANGTALRHRDRAGRRCRGLRRQRRRPVLRRPSSCPTAPRRRRSRRPRLPSGFDAGTVTLDAQAQPRRDAAAHAPGARRPAAGSATSRPSSARRHSPARACRSWPLACSASPRATRPRLLAATATGRWPPTSRQRAATAACPRRATFAHAGARRHAPGLPGVGL